MPASITNIAVELTAILAAADLSVDCSFTRTYLPEYDKVKQGAAARGFVVALDNGSIETATRGSVESLKTIKVAVCKPVSTATLDADMDALSAFMEELSDFIMGQAEQVAEGVLEGVSNSPAYDPALLSTNSLFLSTIVLTYRVQR